MVTVSLVQKEGPLDLSIFDEKALSVAKTIENKSGLGNDFLGWLDYASKLSKEELNKMDKNVLITIIGVLQSQLNAIS